MKRLTDYLNTGYIDAGNRLRPKGSKQKIVAYVESYDDVSFWRTLLDEYESPSYHFQVMLPSQSSLSKGKKTAMMNMLGNGLGKNMIACVDSDYDYLLQGATETSRQLINSPFVLHTYVYAIENFKCYAPCLRKICVQSTLNDHTYIDLEAYMQLYSQTTYPLFVWNILFYRLHKLNIMPLMEFCNIVRLDSVDVSRPQRSLQLLQLRVSRKVASLEREYAFYKEKVEVLKNELLTLGVTPQNTYLFIQGHHIMNHVVMRLLVPLCNRLRKEREKEISVLAKHNRQYANELSSYRHSQSPIDDTLRRNTFYIDSEPYQKLKEEIEIFLKTL